LRITAADHFRVALAIVDARFLLCWPFLARNARAPAWFTGAPTRDEAEQSGRRRVS